MKEKWKDVIGYEGRYEVSNTGRVRRGKIHSRSAKTGTEITVRIDHYGYPVVDLWDGGKSTRPRVHRLMMLAFKGPAPKGFECCHANGIKTDNRLSNLYWGTRSDNNKDFYKHGGVRGFNNPIVMRKALKSRGLL